MYKTIEELEEDTEQVILMIPGESERTCLHVDDEHFIIIPRGVIIFVPVDEDGLCQN